MRAISIQVRKKTDTGKMMKNIIILSLPAIIEYTFHVLVNYADFIMVGKLETDASATIGITNEVTFLFKAGINAIGVGVIAYFAKKIGEGKYDKLNNAALQAYILALIAGVVMTVLSVVISPFLPVVLKASKEIQKPASVYFAVSSSTGVFFSLNVVAGCIRKTTKDMKTPLAVNGFVNIINVILNWLLIYPSFSIFIFRKKILFPRADMGVVGAAWGTAISVAIGGIIMLLANEKVNYISVKDCVLSKKEFKDYYDINIIKKYIVVGIPAFFTSLITSIGRIIFTAMIVPLGTIVYAAHSISFAAESAFYIPAVGMASVVAVLSGNVRGEGNLKKLNRQTNLLCFFIMVVMFVESIIMLIFAEKIIMIFSSDADILKISPVLLRIAAVNEPLFGISIVMQNVFNGIGKTKPPLIISVLTQWGIRVLGVYFFIIVLGYGIRMAWICMIMDNIVRAIMMYIWYHHSNKELIM